jgi:hypothetical protein
MAGHGEKFSRLQTRAIAALLTAPTQGDAAREVGVSERTLHNWLQGPQFRAAVRGAAKELLTVTLSRLQAAARDATDTLIRSLNCGNAASEVRAAGLLLENAIKVSELLDLQERVEALESKMGGKTYVAGT